MSVHIRPTVPIALTSIASSVEAMFEKMITKGSKISVGSNAYAVVTQISLNLPSPSNRVHADQLQMHQRSRKPAVVASDIIGDVGSPEKRYPLKPFPITVSANQINTRIFASVNEPLPSYLISLKVSIGCVKSLKR